MQDRPDERHDPRQSRAGSARNVIFWMLAALLVALPTITLPETGGWIAVKAFTLEVVAIVLAVLIVSRGDWTGQRVRAALLAGPNLAILGFVAWIGISAAVTNLPSFGRYEAMRHLGGALIYFVVVYGISIRRQLDRLLLAIALAAGAASLLAFLNYGESDIERAHGAFRNSQLLAGFLCLVFPVVLITWRSADQNWLRLSAQVATVIVAAGILLSRNRSAWVGVAVALIVLAVLYFRYATRDGGWVPQKHQVVVPVVMLVLSIGLFITMSRSGGVIGERVNTVRALGQDETLQWRIGMWDKALRMTRDRPLLGWGVGSFPVQQALYYHPAAPSRTQREIIKTGHTLGENAHNTYLQLAAELGVPGLLLYLAVFIGFFATAFRTLRRMRPGFQQSVLISCVAAIIAQMVSAVGTPAWEFAECSLFVWLIL
ncbi:MAG TPA: O-antigen ligase family protein, partial [Armatimonadota bacterium]|nr:O-antigen ligase family protein [Armatimonadota bacterium]